MYEEGAALQKVICVLGSVKLVAHGECMPSQKASLWVCPQMIHCLWKPTESYKLYYFIITGLLLSVQGVQEAVQGRNGRLTPGPDLLEATPTKNIKSTAMWNS